MCKTFLIDNFESNQNVLELKQIPPLEESKERERGMGLTSSALYLGHCVPHCYNALNLP